MVHWSWSVCLPWCNGLQRDAAHEARERFVLSTSLRGLSRVLVWTTFSLTMSTLGSPQTSQTARACTVVGGVAVGCSIARFIRLLGSRQIFSFFRPSGAATLAHHRMMEGNFPMLGGCAEWRERFEATFEANTRRSHIPARRPDIVISASPPRTLHFVPCCQ